jgi:alkylated DNA repair dioxygenase AlkB
VTEYEPGAPIGWHKDRAIFADVIGISLLSLDTCLVLDGTDLLISANASSSQQSLEVPHK